MNNNKQYYETPDFSSLENDGKNKYSESYNGFKMVTTIYGKGDFSQELIVVNSSVFYVYKNLGGWPENKPEPIFEYDLREINLGGEESQKFKSAIVYLPEELGPRIQILENVWNMDEWNVAIELKLNENGFYSICTDRL